MFARNGSNAGLVGLLPGQFDHRTAAGLEHLKEEGVPSFFKVDDLTFGASAADSPVVYQLFAVEAKLDSIVDGGTNSILSWRGSFEESFPTNAKVIAGDFGKGTSWPVHIDAIVGALCNVASEVLSAVVVAYDATGL